MQARVVMRRKRGAKTTKRKTIRQAALALAASSPTETIHFARFRSRTVRCWGLRDAPSAWRMFRAGTDKHSGGALKVNRT
jgi:hypothetical protein